MGNCLKRVRNDDVSLLRGNESIQRDNSDQAIVTIYESQNNGRNAYYETGPTLSNNRPVDQLSEEEQIKMAKRIGLIQYLPIGTYDGCKKTRECVICMVEFQPTDTLRYLPCMHKYHVKCIDDWLMRSLTCPSCLEPVDAALLTILNSSECLSSPKIFSSIWNSLFDITSSTQSNENVQVLKLNNNGNSSLLNTKLDNDNNDNIKETIAYSCAGCVNNKFKITSDQLTALRIEYIKHQILSKLRLKEPPKITLPLRDLPLPTLTDNMILSRTQNEEYSDDFYGKTAQAIFFTYTDVKCYQKFHGASVCLPFNITTDIHESDLKSAELWLYKVKDKLDNHNQTFVISEFAHWDSNKSFQKMKPIAIHETNIGQDWIVIDIVVFVRNWIKYQDYVHTINVVCKTCAMDTSKSPIHIKKDGFKPFLILKTFSEMKRRFRKPRLKRSLNCIPGLNECCRDALHISFAEIGWNNWILSPSGYNAYFCHGSCSTAAAITLTEPNYNSVIQKLLYGSKTNRKLELIPCCAATQFKSLELTYANNRSFITKKILPNMIVDTCGCM